MEKDGEATSVISLLFITHIRLVATNRQINFYRENRLVEGRMILFTLEPIFHLTLQVGWRETTINITTDKNKNRLENYEMKTQREANILIEKSKL